jgi:muramoyltetrapeptide carboxypeptidase
VYNHGMAFTSMPLIAPGGRLSIVAASGPFDRAKFDQGLELLKSRYDVAVAPEAFDAFRYLAGPDERRRSALQRCLDDRELPMVMAARGGYGAMRLLPELRLDRPATLVGFSDVTALHLAWQARGWRSVHGPVVTQLGTQPSAVVTRLFDLLEGKPVGPLLGADTLHPGVVEGPLIGGNLALVASLCGTRFMPSLDGAVLLLEDIGERPYRLDRMWTQLELSGALSRIAGVVLGEFTDCEEKDATFTSAEVLRDLVGGLGVPALAGVHVGHGAVNQPVVLGARVRLDATAKRLEFLEGLA